jgi:hypothetical protein
VGEGAAMMITAWKKHPLADDFRYVCEAIDDNGVVFGFYIFPNRLLSSWQIDEGIILRAALPPAIEAAVIERWRAEQKAAA